jgi:RNA polymerase sigma factor (sigma-70 family)
MRHANPLADDAPNDSEDVELALLAQSGDKDALESLIKRHQRWIYNIALRMLVQPQEAEDASQEILVKVVTRLSTFRGESQFRTWLYRVAANHLLNAKRAVNKGARWTFDEYRRELHDIADAELPDPNAVSPESRLVVDEARIGCTSAMLLCLDAEQRLIYVLGAIFGVSDRVGAELLDISRDNFRQKLSRARRDLRAFMNDECGLVNTSNPCRCAKKTQGFIKAGYIDARTLLFARDRTANRVQQLEDQGVGNNQADSRHRHPQPRALDHDAEIAMQGELESSGKRVTVHRGDGRLA